MEQNNKYGAAECGDCNTCDRNCNGQSEQTSSSLPREGRGGVDNFLAAVQAAAAVDRNSYEKNLQRERMANQPQSPVTGAVQRETFSKNAVVRPDTPNFEGAQLSQNHEGLTLYTLIIYSENFAGILNQITAVFTRRQVNIESLNVCASSTPGVHKYTITCYCKQEMAEMLVKQIEKKIDVLQANCFVDQEIFINETSLLKLSTPMVLADPDISRIVRHHNAQMVEVNPTYTTVAKTGITDDVVSLFNQLNAKGCVLQFARSGRIAITRSCIERLDQYLTKREEERN